MKFDGTAKKALRLISKEQLIQSILFSMKEKDITLADLQEALNQK